MVGVLFSLDSNHGLGFGKVQLPIPKRQSLAKGQVNVKHIFGNFGSKLLPFVNICIGLLHYFSLIYETMLLQLSMFHKIPKIKKEFSIQINPNPNPNSNPRVVPTSSTLAYPHTAHIHCGPTNELTQNQSLGPISKAPGPTIKDKAKHSGVHFPTGRSVARVK